MNGYLLLSGAIAAEIVATSTLKAAEGFSRLVPSLVVVIGYIVSFLLLSQVVRQIPLGVAYAIWCSVGIIGTTLAAIWLYGQKPDLPAVAGISLILAGVVVIHLFSNVSGH